MVMVTTKMAILLQKGKPNKAYLSSGSFCMRMPSLLALARVTGSFSPVSTIPPTMYTASWSYVVISSRQCGVKYTSLSLGNRSKQLSPVMVRGNSGCQTECRMKFQSDSYIIHTKLKWRRHKCHIHYLHQNLNYMNNEKSVKLIALT